MGMRVHHVKTSAELELAVYEKAAAGDGVGIAPGLYELKATLVINKAMSLFATEGSGVLIRHTGDDACAIELYGKGCTGTVSDLAIENPGRFYCGGGGTGVGFTDGASAVLARCDIRSCKYDGVVVFNAAGLLENCNIHDNGRYGVKIWGEASSPTVTNNRMYDNYGGDDVFYDRADDTKCRIERNFTGPEAKVAAEVAEAKAKAQAGFNRIAPVVDLLTELGLADLSENAQLVSALLDNGLTSKNSLHGLEVQNLMAIGLKMGDANKVLIAANGNSSVAVAATPPRAPPRTPTAPADEEDFSTLMEALQLSAFVPKLKEEGYAFVSDLQDLSVEEMMEDLGMKKPQARRLARHFVR